MNSVLKHVNIDYSVYIRIPRNNCFMIWEAEEYWDEAVKDTVTWKRFKDWQQVTK